MKKTLYIKVPVAVALKASERGLFNPEDLNLLLTYLFPFSDTIKPRPFTDEILMAYTFKVPEKVHAAYKEKAKQHNMPMSRYVGGLIYWFFTM